MFIDLGGSYFVDNIRILHALPNPPPVQGPTAFSSRTAPPMPAANWLGRRWGSLSDIVRGQNFHDFKFPLAKVEHFAFTYRLHDRSTYEPGAREATGCRRSSFSGKGFLPESQISSEFGGEAPFIEVARDPSEPRDHRVGGRCAAGCESNFANPDRRYGREPNSLYKKNGDLYPGTEEEAAKAWETDKKFFGDASVGPVSTEDAPGQ